MIVDHILIRGFDAGVVRVARILTEPVDVELGEIPASDHFGVFLGMRPQR